MGWAKYLEDNNEIIQERMENRAARARREYSTWNSDTLKINGYIKAKTGREASNIRVKELSEIKESLLYKINLSLSVFDSMYNNTVKCIAQSLNIGLEDSYTKVSKIILSIDNNKNVSDISSVDVKEIKKNLIKTIFYKVESCINNSDVISQDEIEELKEDLLRLINWFYDNKLLAGKIGNKKADIETAKKFIKEELKISICTCPVCGRNTLDGLRFCIECAGEW